MSLLIEAGGMRSSAFFSNRTAPVRLSRMIAALAGVSNACAGETNIASSPSRTRIGTSRSRIVHLVGWVEPKGLSSSPASPGPCRTLEP